MINENNPFNPFSERLLHSRLRSGMTQEQLAEKLKVSVQSVRRWELGKTAAPNLYARKRLCELFSTSEQELGLTMSPSVATDWNEAQATAPFYGRESEIRLLEQWIVKEHCRVVSLLGMGGIGKSALATQAMRQLTSHFDIVIWRSLRDAPSCDVLLESVVVALKTFQPFADVSASVNQLAVFLEYCRRMHVLIVLDNLESLLESNGHMRQGFEEYAQLLVRMAAETEQSCMIITSREKPRELRSYAYEGTHIRSIHLSGLDLAACHQILSEKNIVSSPEKISQLVTLYAAHPLALKIVSETVVDLFNGDITDFLQNRPVIFGDITELLVEQFARLSPMEFRVVCWFAIVREPTTIAELHTFLAPVSDVQLIDAVDRLRRRSLIELGSVAGTFTLQSVIMEYAMSKLINTITNEMRQGTLKSLIDYGLELGAVKEYVRQTQQHLIVASILAGLRSSYPLRTTLERQLLALLEKQRERADDAQGYGPANLIALLRVLRGNLCGLDLSLLDIRGAYLQGVEMQDTSLAGAMIHDTLLTEAHGAIWSVAINSAGTMWAAGSRRGEIRIWNERGLILYRVWPGHTDIVSTLAFSPDGSLLASGARDTTVKIWDVASGELQQTLLQDVQDPAAVFAVAWSPNGSLLASGDFDGTIRLWEMKMKSMVLVQTIEEHTDMVKGLAWSPDGSLLASGSWDYMVKLWDVKGGTLHQKQTLSGHTDKLHHLAWSPDGHTLASCAVDKTIRIWNVEQGRCRAILLGHTSGVYSIAYTPDGNSLLSGSEDGTLRVWDTSTKQCIRISQGYNASLQDIDWSPDGTQLISGSTNGDVIIWDVAKKVPYRMLEGHSWIIGGVAWGSQWAASCEWHTVIRLWDTTTGRCIRELRDPIASPMSVARSPDGMSLACGTSRHGAQVWDMATGTLRWDEHISTPVIRHVSWSPDGSLLVGGGDDGSVYLWRATDGVLAQKFQGHHGIVIHAVWSPDGSLLASCGGSGMMGELYLWRATDGVLVQKFQGHHGIVSAIVWSPDGTLISGGTDGNMYWWNVHSGERLWVRIAHQGTVQSLRCNPDGSLLASCGDDGAIMLWDVQSGELKSTIRRDRPYERLNITGVRGLTDAQKATMRTLGAFEVQEN